ncbi:hypothetical protein [Sorangium sp. So ce513]|uniref:hypothetical protein n=1 Tax=Sorangium sp. So ce513 TaxID=3133315 RepID=UPI003F5D65C3
MDGDIFSKVTRPGRAAGEAVLRALQGGAWDPFHAEQCVDILIETAGGVPSLASVLDEVRSLNKSPLFARLLADEASDRVDSTVTKLNGSVLDLILKAVTQKCILRGVLDEREILTRFVVEVLDHAIISCRGGVLDQHGDGQIAGVRALLRSVAVDAAAELLRRPDAKRLGLSHRHARITAETNLLEGFP